MEHIERKLKEYYDDWLRRRPRGWINALSPQGTRLKAISDVSPKFIYIYLITRIPVQYGRILHECRDVFSRVRRTSENTPCMSAICRIAWECV